MILKKPTLIRQKLFQNKSFILLTLLFPQSGNFIDNYQAANQFLPAKNPFEKEPETFIKNRCGLYRAYPHSLFYFIRLCSYP